MLLCYSYYVIYNSDFTYDAEGKPISIYYNQSVFYYYVTNLQGDVVGIVDKNGNQIVSYTYDAWGNILSISGSKASTVGLYNPLRYRSYVYDPETELYYLQSRYYDPSLGRFLNADAFASTGQGILGNNMFAYCLNNPVMFKDLFGFAATKIDLTDQDKDGDGLPDEPSGASPGAAGSINSIGSSGQGAQTTGIGFSSFSSLKSYLGPAGMGKHWHHIVEKCQIQKSGFSSLQVNNTSNVIAVDEKTHARITGYYNTTTFRFTDGMSVRNWLAGQSYDVQFDFGMNVLRDLGVIP